MKKNFWRKPYVSGFSLYVISDRVNISVEMTDGNQAYICTNADEKVKLIKDFRKGARRTGPSRYILRVEPGLWETTGEAAIYIPVETTLFNLSINCDRCDAALHSMVQRKNHCGTVENLSIQAENIKVEGVNVSERTFLCSTQGITKGSVTYDICCNDFRADTTILSNNANIVIGDEGIDKSGSYMLESWIDLKVCSTE